LRETQLGPKPSAKTLSQRGIHWHRILRSPHSKPACPPLSCQGAKTHIVAFFGLTAHEGKRAFSDPRGGIQVPCADPHARLTVGNGEWTTDRLGLGPSQDPRRPRPESMLELRGGRTGTCCHSWEAMSWLRPFASQRSKHPCTSPFIPPP